MMTKQPYGTVLIKAAKILEVLSEAGQPKSLQYIAQNAALTSSTALKILDTLILIGYVQKNEESKQFSLGSRLIQYANDYLQELEIVKIATPYLHQLQAQIDETIHLGIEQEDGVMYVEKLEPKNQSIYMTSKVGVVRPLYSSGMGKAILSEYTKEQLDDYLARTTLEAFTEYTITDEMQLRKEIKQIQTQKLAFDNEEMEADCFCIAASLMKKGKITGAFSVSMPKFRLTKERETAIVQAVLGTKKQIESAL